MIRLSTYLYGILDPTSPEAKAAWDSACLHAFNLDEHLIIDGNFVLPRTIRVNKMMGEVGSSITIDSRFTKTGVQKDYAFENRNYSKLGIGRPTADSISIIGVTIKVFAPTNMAVFGYANVSSGEIVDTTIIAESINKSSPQKVDALIDFRACCKNVTVADCLLTNINGWHGATISTAGGGGEIWIRNDILSNGSLDENHTAGINVARCAMSHCTSDESVAIYGVNGVTRDCSLSECVINSEPLSGNLNGEPLHHALVTIFPGDSGGDNAAVYRNTISNNKIIDKSIAGHCVRIGLDNASDPDNMCYENRVCNNEITIHPVFGFGAGAAIYSLPHQHPAEFSFNEIHGNSILAVGPNFMSTGIFGLGSSSVGRNRITGSFERKLSNCNPEVLMTCVKGFVDGSLQDVPSSGETLNQIREDCGGLYIGNGLDGVLRFFGGPTA